MASMSEYVEIETQLTREDALARLGSLAGRLHIDPSAIRVRPVQGSRTAMQIDIRIAGGTLTKRCNSQPTKDKNFVCLVLWLGDLVRNIERGIETFGEAFYNEGSQGLVLRSDGAYEGLRVNEYDGDATRADSFTRFEHALARLGLTSSDIRVTWDEARNVGELRLVLRTGREVAKASSRQRDVDRNIHVLALWLQTKAKNFERGLEPDLETLFAANLLPV